MKLILGGVVLTIIVVIIVIIVVEVGKKNDNAGGVVTPTKQALTMDDWIYFIRSITLDYGNFLKHH